MTDEDAARSLSGVWRQLSLDGGIQSVLSRVEYATPSPGAARPVASTPRKPRPAGVQPSRDG